MAYFNNAFQKAGLVTEVYGAADLPTGDLSAGQLGLVDGSDYETATFPTTDTSAVPTEFLLVQGNWNQVDTLGNNPAAGGYAESYKTKVIKQSYIRKIWKQDCVAVGGASIVITIPDGCFLCDGSTNDANQLRLDIKGEETLRFLNRFSYAVFNFNECCDGDGDDGAKIEGGVVATAWATAINTDPLMKHFVTAVGAGTTTGTLTLTVAYTPTFFADCSLDTRDYVGTAPLEIQASVVDDDGDPCTDTCMTVVGDAPADTTWPVIATATKAETTGETVVRELIMDGRYRQDGGWNQGNKDSARFREIEYGDKLSAAVDRTAFYACYYLLHSVPRYNNPTGVFDNDQYLYKFYVPCSSPADDNIAKMDFLWNSISHATGLAVGDLV